MWIYTLIIYNFTIKIIYSKYSSYIVVNKGVSKLRIFLRKFNWPRNWSFLRSSLWYNLKRKKSIPRRKFLSLPLERERGNVPSKRIMRFTSRRENNENFLSILQRLQPQAKKKIKRKRVKVSAVATKIATVSG